MEEQPIPVKIVRSRRKKITICVTSDAEVIIRAPYYVSEQEIRRVVSEKQDWIVRSLQSMELKKREREEMPSFSREEIQEMADAALRVIPERVRHFAPLVGVTYGRVTIRNQRTRWGSCSSIGNLNFNCLLMKAPPEVMDYVVVHELCHRKEMNHSKKFWAEVERVMPDYGQWRKWLKEHGGELIDRMERGMRQ